MIQPRLETLGFAHRNVDFDRIKRARRRRGAKVIVLAADPSAPRQSVGAEQDAGERLERQRAAAIRFRVRGHGLERGQAGKAQVARQRESCHFGI